jgi:hypothetical protein
MIRKKIKDEPKTKKEVNQRTIKNLNLGSERAILQRNEKMEGEITRERSSNTEYKGKREDKQKKRGENATASQMNSFLPSLEIVRTEVGIRKKMKHKPMARKERNRRNIRDSEGALDTLSIGGTSPRTRQSKSLK